MAEETMETPGVSAAGPEAVFTEEQRGVFGSAGLWMTIVGWIEVLAGVLLGVLGLLSWWRVVPPEEALPTPLDRATWVIQAAFTICLGALTLRAACAFRRASRHSGRGHVAVTEAVSRLRELYARQVWFFVLLLGAAVVLAILGR